MHEAAFAFVAGMAGCLGPCAAPRYLALAALRGGTSMASLLAFTLGVTAGSATLVLSSAALARALAWSSALYIVLSVAFIGFGLRTLLDVRPWCCTEKARASSLGTAFSLGAACSFLPSPCCTPVLVGLGTFGVDSPDVLRSLSIAAAFALGHVVPPVALTLVAEPAARRLATPRAGEAVRTVGAGLSLALGAYYAVLT